MSSFLSRASNNTQAQFATTAIVSGAVVAGTILGYQKLQRKERVHRLKNSIPSLEDAPKPAILNGGASKAEQEDARNAALARRAQAGDYDDELILEQLARNRVFLTPAGLDRVRGAFVVVVGCGGVGSHAAAALARSGVARLRLVDFDQVTLSSLNRHAVATLADVGSPKVQCLQRRLLAIAPWTRFDLRQEKYWDGAAERLLEPWREGISVHGGGTEEGAGHKPDFVIDAIDNIDTKVALLKRCHDAGLPVISSMGAGCKSDPTRIMVGDISASTDDGLSRATRRRLKLLGVTKGIPTVFSTEKTAEGKAELLPLPEDEFAKGRVGDLGVMPDFRVRILPVLGTMPAVFGYTAANHVILSVAGYPTDYPIAKSRDKMYDSVLAALQGSEVKLLRSFEDDPDAAVGLRIPVSAGDVAFLVEEVFRGRSAVSGLATRLHLVRWRRPARSTLVQIGAQKSSDLKLGDLVCLTKEEAARHEKIVLGGGGQKTVEELYDAKTVEKVEAALREAAGYEAYR